MHPSRGIRRSRCGRSRRSWSDPVSRKLISARTGATREQRGRSVQGNWRVFCRPTFVGHARSGRGRPSLMPPPVARSLPPSSTVRGSSPLMRAACRWSSDGMWVAPALAAIATSAQTSASSTWSDVMHLARTSSSASQAANGVIDCVEDLDADPLRLVMIAAVLVSPALDVPRLEGCGGYVSTSGPLPSRSAGRVQTSSAHRRCKRAQRSASPPTRACLRRRRGASPRQENERRGRSRGASTSHARSGQAKVEGRGAPSQRSRRQQASRTGSRHRSRQRAELRAPVGRRSASRPAR